MQRIILCFFSSCFLLAACIGGQHENKEDKKVITDQLGNKKEDNKSSNAHEGWYKHYTGTVGGQAIALNLYYSKGINISGENNARNGIYYNGNYCYISKGEIVDLSLSRVKGDSIDFVEDIPGANDDMLPHWDLYISDSSAKGKWVNKDGTKTYPIELREDYSGGAYQLDVVSADDTDFSSLMLLTPSAKMKSNDAIFLEKTLLHVLGDDTLGAKNIREFIKKSSKHYTRENDSDNITLNATCDYNANNILAFDFSWYEFYAGAAHGNYWSKHVCIDMLRKKLWDLSDLIKIDTQQINQLLSQEARKYFKISANDTLGNYLLVSEIPPTNNIIITGKGLTFCYDPGEIAGYAFGEVDLFLPYNKLSDMLKPDFKKRMNL
jgi:hypothetical protein